MIETDITEAAKCKLLQEEYLEAHGWVRAHRKPNCWISPHTQELIVFSRAWMFQGCLDKGLLAVTKCPACNKPVYSKPNDINKCRTCRAQDTQKTLKTYKVVLNPREAAEIKAFAAKVGLNGVGETVKMAALRWIKQETTLRWIKQETTTQEREVDQHS